MACAPRRRSAGRGISDLRARNLGPAARRPRPYGKGESRMSFEHPWLLLLSLAPLAWCAYEWPNHSRHLALVTKAATILLIALALAGPILSWSERKIALAVVADTSASVSPQDLAHEQN